MRKPITFRCFDCGEVTTRTRQTGDVLVCFECGKARVAAYNDRQRAGRLARGDTLRGGRLESVKVQAAR